MSRLLHFFRSNRVSEELARWERTAQVLRTNIIVLRGRPWRGSREGADFAQQVLDRVVLPHLRHAA